MTNQDKTVLITGATGGIGEELSIKFAGHGYGLILTARKAGRLEDLAQRLRSVYGVAVTAIQADFREENAPQQLYDTIVAKGLQVDVLVNNAGFGLAGNFIHTRPDLQMAMICVNIVAVTQLCRLIIPDMVSRGRGRVLNVASTGGFVCGPMNSVYCATKAYVLSLSEALAEELENSGVTVTTLCPGATRTGFASRSNMESTRLFRYGVMAAREVAEAAYAAMSAGKRLEVPGWLNKAVVQALRITPRVVAAKLSKMIQRPLDWE